MTRIEATFARTKAEKRPALIPFIMGYDGDTLAQLAALVEGGADIIEIGVPFSDPMADGPVIAAAGLRALAAGATLAKILALVAEFRKTNSATPIILMGYYNPIYRYGCETFCADAARAGVDGMIVVDLPPEEEAELAPFAKKHALDFIRLLAPTSTGERLKSLTAHASGFLYTIAVAGITGGKSADLSELKTRIAEIRGTSSLPVAVGFGIKTPSQAAELKDVADAVVIGSALVEAVHQSGGKASVAGEFIQKIAETIHGR